MGFQAIVRILPSVSCLRKQFVGENPRRNETYVWEPGPREDGSWYICVFKVENTAVKRSLAIDLRCGAGAMVRRCVSQGRQWQRLRAVGLIAPSLPALACLSKVALPC